MAPSSFFARSSSIALTSAIEARPPDAITGIEIASASATDYTVPDLSAVTGFQSWWGLVAAVSTHWQQFANWSDAGVADLLRADQTAAELDGREYKITQRDGTITF